MHGSELISSIFRVFFYCMVIFAVIIILSFVYRQNTVNSYTEECNEVISRTGGVTPRTRQELDNLGQNTYHGLFTVTPSSSAYAHQQRFGEPIYYRLHSHIPFIGTGGFMGMPHTDMNVSSSERVNSNIRANSQHYTN